MEHYTIIIDLLSSFIFFSSSPLSIVNQLSLPVIQNPFSVKIAAAKLSFVFLSCRVEQCASTVSHEIVCIADVCISVGVGNLCLPDQQPVHPFPFEFLAVGKDQHPTPAEFSHFHVAHLADHRLPSFPLCELEHSALLHLVFQFGRRGTIARVLER